MNANLTKEEILKRALNEAHKVAKLLFWMWAGLMGAAIIALYHWWIATL